ncbi:MAG TPA: hypothetical protein VND64_21165 [Pirellulales bacterium]|nr:hypothetical protein [Pirellulales bacterium]
MNTRYAACYTARYAALYTARYMVVIAVLPFLPALAHAAGMAHDENFIVIAADEALAEEVLAKANQYRDELAEEWLGAELPPSVGRAIIDVHIADDDQGRTWVIDAPDRKHHMLWLTTTRPRALGGMLRHELTHAVLATELPGRLPAWADEGAASLADDEERLEIRRQTIAWFSRTGNWPDLETIFAARSIVASDKASYAVSASLTEYLLARGDKPRFLKFAVEGKAQGWPRALRTHYEIQSVAQLEHDWRLWATSPNRQ